MKGMSSSNNRYRFVPEAMTWNEHDHRAMEMGGHLASITNAEENDYDTQGTQR